MITLKARKEFLPVRQVGKYASGWQTYISDLQGNLKAVIPVNQKQPRKGTKTILLNCNTYSLIWD